MGFLAPWTESQWLQDFSGPTSAGAINIAIDEVKKMNLVEDVEFEIVTRDSACDTKQAGGYMVELHVEEHVDIVIGPPCSIACFVAGQLASFWNIPMISWVATDIDFNDKMTYSTLGRTLGPFSKLGLFLLNIMEGYQWNRVVVISSTFLLFGDASKAIVKTFNANNVTVAYYAEYKNNPTVNRIRTILEKTKSEGRIVIICAPKLDRRVLMLEAYDMGMTNGEYVFYTVEMLPESDVISAQETYLGNDERDEEARQAFEAVFHMSLASLTAESVDGFTVEVARRLQDKPWNMTLPDGTKGNKYSAFLYDAILLYILALNETVAKGDDYRDGEVMLQAMSGKFFKGMTGNVLIDEFGDREPDYWISDLQPNGLFVKIAEVLNLENGTRIMRQLREPRWGDGTVGHQFAPSDVPPCGFEGELCKAENSERIQYESDLLSMRWKIHYDEIQMIASGSQQRMGLTSRFGSQGDVPREGSKNLGSTSTKNSEDMKSSTTTKSMQYFCKTGIYKGVQVALKKIKKEHMQINRNVLVEFNEIRDINHDNLNLMIGACVVPPHLYLVWQYCPKGSLQDVLENDDVKLDHAFKISFIMDIVKGMEYLHKSKHGNGSHGNLKSPNCLVDSRWVVKITDYGLPSFVQGQSEEVGGNQQDRFLRKIWTAPEILRMNFPPICGTQRGDVYSFGIILFEIIERSAPYTFEHITPRDVVNRIRNGESTPYRPNLQNSLQSEELGVKMTHVMIRCWSENPDERPLFSKLRSELRSITGSDNVSIMDNILNMMEKYSNNLEEIVEERTEQLVEEKKKTDRLLYRMLPPSVAEQLKIGRTVDPQTFDSATIYFSDIVGFTTLSSESTPIQVVDFLNDLYSCFDGIISNHDVYKVETIGDAYMIVSGVPQRNGNRHAAEIANCALDLLSTVTHFKIRHRPRAKLQLRIGIHTGPTVAGVVGLVMPRYCLFGDTVNMASRMESTGKPFHIHISKQTYSALSDFQLGYKMKARGDINVKGKGLLTTYFLFSKEGYKSPLPSDMKHGENNAEHGGDYDSVKESESLFD
ncbi:atrial natriuretic peptide receptor 1-like [Glandiceps talaboti]